MIPGRAETNEAQEGDVRDSCDTWVSFMLGVVSVVLLDPSSLVLPLGGCGMNPRHGGLKDYRHPC